MVYTITIPGECVPKGRPRAYVNRQGHARMYTPERSVRFEDLVRLAAHEAKLPVLGGAIGVQIDATFAWPKSKQLTRGIRSRAWMPEKPDADNLAKSVLDGLNAHFRDQQVAHLVVTKKRERQDVPPSTRITIFTFEETSTQLPAATNQLGLLTATEGSHAP